jgi:hypothetical protein
VSAEIKPPQRGLTAITGALSLLIVLLIVQIWLLTASLESYLAGHSSIAIPAAAVSAILFLGCLALYIFVVRVDSEAR